MKHEEAIECIYCGKKMLIDIEVGVTGVSEHDEEGIVAKEG